MGLVLTLAACGTTKTPAAQTGPYANNQSYPWSYPTAPSGSDPYANNTSYPWTGVKTGSSQSGSQGLGSNGVNFLSDLSFTSATNSWGPIEKDSSNGEQAPGDGKPLTIGTQTFTKGLGVHANSEIVYTLSGMCQTFTATVGIDAEVSSNPKASVFFQVWNGATKLYDSGLVTATTPGKAISVPISGVQNLRLVVTDAGDGISYDHADWGDAQVVCPPEQPSGGQYLSDLSWTSAMSSWGPVEKDMSNGEKLANDGHKLTIGTQTFAKGLGVHANSEIVYPLSSTCTTFTATVGIDAEVKNNPKASVIFQVWNGATKLYDSGKVTAATPPVAVSVPISGMQSLKLVVTDAGDGISYDHADWGNAKINCAAISAPPAAPANLKATPSASGTVLSWNANTESDLAGYQVSRASQSSGPFTLLTTGNLSATAYTDTAAPQGVVSYYRVVAVNQSGAASSPSSISATRSNSGTPQIAIQNLDAFPYNDRLVFSRLGTPGNNYNHDHVTLRISNVGSGSLVITDLPMNSSWAFDPAPTLPLSVAAGNFTDLSIKFVYPGPSRVQQGTLNIVSNDAQTPNLPVQLAGVWQSLPENGEEPTPQQVATVFGFNVSFLSSGQASIDQYGLVRPQGAEVISPYWMAAAAGQPVTVRQIAAYHGQNNGATIFRFAKTALTSGIPVNTVATLRGSDAQTLMPRNNTSTPVLGTFTPAAADTFGFRVDGEWSEPRLNAQGTDRKGGCAGPCGQHVRFYPVADRNGTPMPNTYLLIMDYNGINYDYNDNMYIISNIKPASVLINVGGPNTTDPATGNVWLADKEGASGNNYALFTPANTIAEGSYYANYPGRTGPIAKTTNPIYTTYRGNAGTSAPVGTRILTFQVPIDNGTYQVKLHFADLYWNTAGQRVFDISAQGILRAANFDIISRVGPSTADVLTLDNVPVTDGKITLTFNASVDFTSISGIEIVR